MRAILVGWVVMVAACMVPGAKHPFTGTLPRGTHLALAGNFTLSPDGELRLALAERCNVDAERVAAGSLPTLPCVRAQLDQIHVIARTPLGLDVRGTWADPAHLVFHVDWKASGLDPLADDAASVVARPWVISGTRWSPTSAEAARILRLVCEATETETELVRGGLAPSLEVTALELDGNTLHSAASNTLVVRIANHGPGTAYRVTATTRSSIDALHGRRLSFGIIRPGSDKVRQLTLTIPASETAPDTMLVLVLSEGNGFAPRNVSRRLPIVPAVTAPLLTMRCKMVGHEGARPYVDAGQKLTLQCTVNNTGDAAANQVSVAVSIADTAPSRWAVQAIPAAGQASFAVSIMVPRGLPIDAPVEIAIVARDQASARSTRVTLVGVIRKPTLCTAGQLTRAQYRAKITELRAAVAAGDLTQAEFDRYDAALVTCLQ